MWELVLAGLYITFLALMCVLFDRSNEGEPEAVSVRPAAPCYFDPQEGAYCNEPTCEGCTKKPEEDDLHLSWGGPARVK